MPKIRNVLASLARDNYGYVGLVPVETLRGLVLLAQLLHYSLVWFEELILAGDIVSKFLRPHAKFKSNYIVLIDPIQVACHERI